MIGKNVKIIFLIFIFGLTSTLVSDASVPVTYTCCKNYTYSDGVVLSTFENRDSTGIQLDGFEDLNNWILETGVKEIDAIHFTEGQQGLKLISQIGVNAKIYKVLNHDFSNSNNFAIWIYVHDMSTLNEIEISFTSTGAAWNKKFYKFFSNQNFKSGWNKIIINKGSGFGNIGGESWDNIMNNVSLEVYPITGKSTNITFDNLRYDLENDWIGNSQEADTIHFKEGHQGLKIIAPTGSANDPDYPYASETESDLAINNNFSDVNNFVIWAYIYNETDLNWVRIYFTSNDYTSFFYHSTNYNFRTGWNKLVFNKQDFTNVFNENWNNVMNGVRIRVGDYAGKINVTFDDLRYNISGQKAKFMIEFDDGYYNIYSNAYPILKANNQTGVSYVVTSYVESDDINYMRISDLKTLQSAGWDISSHTVNHAALGKVDDSTQISELNNSYDWLVTNKFQKSAGFIAYPYGSYNDIVLDKVEKRYVLGRSVAIGSAQQHLISDRSIQYLQRTIEVYDDTSVQNIKDRINASINAKLLGKLLFHSIGDPNHIPYDYSTIKLKEISDYLKSRSSDVDVITNSDYVIPNINKFTPVLNKTTTIYSNGSSVLKTNNKYDEYMPNMTVKPSSGSIDIGITAYNETGGLIKFNESSPNSNVQVSYEIGDRIPNKIYSVKIYWVNGTKYQEFYSLSNSTGFIKYDSTGFGNARYQEINITDLITLPLSILDSSPVSDPSSTAGASQSFEINLNKISDVRWYINGSIDQINSSAISANYINSTASPGTYNVTSVASNGSDSVSRTWNWTVTPQKTYNVSGTVYDNFGTGLAGVLVANLSYQNTTISSGFYFISGIPNGTYNFSYNKSGFETGYLEISVTGSDLTNQNKTIYDTTPPSQVTGLVTDIPTQTTVNLSWNPVPDANYYQLFRNSTSLGYTLNPYWNDTGLTPDMLYQYKVRANDSYNNWGQNSSILNVNTATAYVPRYNVSGYVFDNSGIGLAGVLVKNGSYQNTTSTSGIYVISGLSNGTYNISYSKPGFNTGYLEVIILGSDLSNQNKTIYDTTSPNISAISSSNINSTSATISWTTNEASDTQVEYGITPSYGSSSALDTNLVTSHSQRLSGLTASTLYHYRVKSRDAAGNLANSSDQTFTTSALDTSLIASWKFDENTGTIASDSSGNGNDGTISGGAAWTAGKIGNALSFDGINDYVDAGNKPGLQIREAISLEGWIKINDLSVSSDLFGRGHGLSSGNHGYFVTYYSATKSLYFDTYSTTTRDALRKTDAIVDNNWHHIAATWDGTTSANGKKLYIDGVLVAQKTSAIASMGNPAYNFRIGIDSIDSRPAKANIDEVKVYNRALLASEILAEYNAGNIDTTPPIISAITSSNINSTSATISWTTNEASDTQVEYGTTTSYGSSSALDTNLITSHSQRLSGLTASTLYHYRVKSKDAAGNLANSSDQTFTTQDSPGAISGTVKNTSSNIPISGATVTDGTRSVTTDINGNYTISNVPAGIYSVTASASGYQNSIQPGISVIATQTTTVNFYLDPSIDITPPAISAISSSNINSTSATISWTTNEASDTQVEYGITPSYGSSSALDTNLVTSHSQRLSGLTASTLYHYRVKSRDAAGNLANSSDQTFTTSALDTSLIASWKFDENTGTIASDSSGNGNDGTISGGAAWTAGKIGNALSFDGINDYVDAGNKPGLQIREAISLEGWIKINDLSVSSDLFGRGHGLSSGNHGYFVTYYSATKSLYFDTYSTTTRDALRKTDAIVDNNWHHIAATWDGTTSANGKKLYIDGVLVAQKTSAIASMGNPAYNFRIGIDSIDSRPAKANIDEVKVYNRALLASEILAEYNDS